MNILIISDKFKFTFSSIEIGEMIKKNIEKSITSKIEILPISDGGEGFLDAINYKNNFNKILTTTNNPIFEQTESYFLMNNKIAYLEYALTGGLQLIPASKRNPMFTSSYGLGQQIKIAIKKGANKIIIGLGGSATNDVGIGMATAMGYDFLDKNGKKLNPVGNNLLKIYNLQNNEETKLIKKVRFFATTDVSNPLFGENGATNIYAQQKGANSDQIEILEQGVQNIAKIIEQKLKIFLNTEKGEGAAGGLGTGIKSFLNGKIISGSDFIFEHLNLVEKIKRADLIISGEGKIDKQSFQGKIIGKICNITQKYNKRLIQIAGYSDYHPKLVNTKIISLFNKKPNIEVAKKISPKLISEIIFI